MARFATLRARWRTLPPLTVDAAIAVGVLAAHTMPFLLTTRVADPVTGWTLWQYLPVPGMAAALLWRRRAPFVVLLAVLALQAGYTAFDPDIAPQEVAYALLVAIYTAAARCGLRGRTWALTVLGLVGALQALALLVGSLSGETASRGLILMATAWVLGRLTARRQALAERLHAEKEEAARLAVARERAMIARDTHDILGHAISLIVVQAEAGAVVVHTAPDRAETALRAIAESGRGAMAQVRRLLGLWDARDESVRPSLAGIPGLVADTALAGAPVELVVSGEPGALPGDTELAAYRVVQEALTNVVKHAAARAAEVRLDWTPERLAITVTDDGVGPGSGDGRGLIGIRERARACGGTASFGPGLHGRGFAVEVQLPRGSA